MASLTISLASIDPTLCAHAHHDDVRVSNTLHSYLHHESSFRAIDNGHSHGTPPRMLPSCSFDCNCFRIQPLVRVRECEEHHALLNVIKRQLRNGSCSLSVRGILRSTLKFHYSLPRQSNKMKPNLHRNKWIQATQPAAGHGENAFGPERALWKPHQIPVVVYIQD